MAESEKHKSQRGRWDDATWIGVGAGTGIALGVVFGGGTGVAIGLALGAGVGAALAAWRTHHGPGATG